MNPFEQLVRERAYDIWESEGRVFGRAEDHWLTAEAELRAASLSAPVYVQPVTADLSLAPSPAKTLKPRASRSTAAKAVAEKAVVQASETAPRQTRTASAKSSSAKAASAKTPAAPKAASTKTASSSTATKPLRATKPRAVAPMESAATVH
ncbi:DUF2934 domain-containing protein [Methylobacterium sp. CM6244]